MQPNSAVIIGAGIGGLATAGLLARQGVQVTVIEKNDEVGGRAGSLALDGHIDRSRTESSDIRSWISNVFRRRNPHGYPPRRHRT